MRRKLGESTVSKDGRLGTSAHHRMWVLVFCLWVAFVWGHSLVQGPQSSLESSRVVAVVAPLLNALGITGEAAMSFAVRKTAHFLEYAVLGVLAVPTFLVPAREGRLPRWLGPLVVILVPMADETDPALCARARVLSQRRAHRPLRGSCGHVCCHSRHSREAPRGMKDK